MSEINSLADLRPGDIGFGPIGGAAGLLVRAGQLVLGEGFRLGRLHIEHVFVVVQSMDYHGPELAGPFVVEAMAHGAREVEISNGRWGPEWAYCRPPYESQLKINDGYTVARHARAMIRTPYSFASYAALAAWRFGLKAERLEKWIGRRSADGYPCEAICSVLADQAMTLAGFQVFDDGRAPQCVTPGQLARRLLTMPGATWGWGE